MDLNIALIAFLAIFILNFVLRMPMPLGMLAGCVFYFLFAGDPVKMAAQQTLKTFYTNYTIIAIPLFIFAANVMNSGKVTEQVFGFAKCFVGHLRGGLGHVNVLASLIFSGMTGSAIADASGLGKMEIDAMRAEGYDVLSTRQGYVIAKGPFAERVFKLRHTSAQTEDELTTIVSMGGTVVNVFVWHKVYGKVEASLNIFSERSIAQFMDGIKTGKSKELMHITEGYHDHTVRADSEAVLDEIEAVLNEKGYIVPEI